MHTARLIRIVPRLLLLAVGMLPIAHAHGAHPEAAAVESTVRAFHSALTSGDTETAARLLAADAIVMEGGERETRKQYVEHHLLEDVKFAQAVPSQTGAIDVTVNGDVGWASSTSVTQGTYQSKAINLAGAELMVLTKGPSGWLIRAIHWSSRIAK
jgi:ketosteroid isomerase-like protein